MKAFDKNKAMAKLKLQQNKNTYIKKLSISLSCMFLIIVVMLFAFAKFESSSPEYVLINGKVSISLDDVNVLQIYKGDTEVDEFPAKGSGWSFKNATCTNGATAAWDNGQWGLYVGNITSKTSCKVYFRNSDSYLISKIENMVSGESSSSTDVISKGTGSDGCTYTLAYDGTADNNLRYVGANPCNYVNYNGELWRIIGVMSNVVVDENDITKKESLVKIVRSELLGSYSWDTVNGVNSNYGINQWGPSTNIDGTTYEGADIMRELNTDYLGYTTVGTDGKWYSGVNNAKTAAMPSTTLSSTAQNLIQSVVWNTGAPNTDNVTPLAYNATTVLVPYIYQHERYDTTGKVCESGSVCNDEVIRKSTWYGKVGLFYLSDYTYATAGGNSQSRSTCLSTRPGTWNSYGNCYTNNWLRNSSTHQWAISPFAQSARSTEIAYVNSAGNINFTNAYGTFGVRPALYLKKDVLTGSGDGSASTPYNITISSGGGGVVGS